MLLNNYTLWKIMTRNDSVQFSRSVVSDSVTPWIAACQAYLSFTTSWGLLKLMSIESMMPSNHLILCWPLLHLPSIFPSIRVFSNESALRIRWPEYWSFLISISSSNEYSGVRPVIQQTLSPVCWPWAVCWSESPFCILRPQVPKGWLGNISAIYR